MTTYFIVVLATIAGAQKQFDNKDFRYASMAECEQNLVGAVENWIDFIRQVHPGVEIQFTARCVADGVPA